MQICPYRFDRVEFAGSLGDLGTLIPLSIALVTITHLSFTTVFLLVGLFYLATGLYFKLPIPVQPLKVVSAIAIAFPEKVSLHVMSAAGLLFGLILMLLAFTGIIDRLARLFTRPVVRGIQLGLGFILIMKGISFIRRPELFLNGAVSTHLQGGVPLNLVLGLGAVVLVLFLISSRRFPAALVLVASGIIVGMLSGSLNGLSWTLGPTPVMPIFPDTNDFITALFLLVIPQIPLTLGNAVIGTADTAKTLFGEGVKTNRVTPRGLSLSMGLANTLVGLFGGMPMCHGAGGLAAHYRFGARTGGSNIMIGLLFVAIALFLGKTGVTILSSIPNSVLGVLLLFAGLELALLIRDVRERRDLFVAFLMAGVGLATTNMTIAFLTGIAISWIIRWGDIEI